MSEVLDLSDQELRLACRIDQLLGWAKVGQRPEHSTRPEYYTLKGANTDALRNDIISAVRELGGLAS